MVAFTTTSQREPPGGEDAWNAYRRDTAAFARHVAILATGRDPVVPDFPPLVPAADIRSRLGDRQLILSFHWTDGGLTGVLESRDRFAIWDVRQAAGLPAEIALFARGLCLFDAQAPVGTDKLAASDWRGPAARIERMLFENSRVALGEGIDELVIVPDGWLWYVPFELLPVSSAEPGTAAASARRLGESCRIRYCPTRSLAVAGFQPPGAPGPVGVVAGRMNRGDDAATIADVLSRVGGTVERTVPVAGGGPPDAETASVFAALAVFDESVGDGAQACLAPSAPGRAGISFADWLAPPPKRPWLVVLPGMQTALATGLEDKSLPSRPGDDLFLPTTDLLAAGAHTAVVSRWRAGGATCVALMSEFLREATAAQAEPVDPVTELWRRAVEIGTAERPDPAREPRLRQSGDAVLDDARHPFFWAGYVLVDRGSEPAPAAAAAPGKAP